jgi:hypothetical protein
VPNVFCDPIIRKQVSPAVAKPGDEVVFTIAVANVGREAKEQQWTPLGGSVRTRL